MGKNVKLTWADFDKAVADLAAEIDKLLPDKAKRAKTHVLYGIPRGGLPIATALSHATGIGLSTKPSLDSKVILVDEIIDTGEAVTEAIQTTFRPGNRVVIVAAWIGRKGFTVPDGPPVIVQATFDTDAWFDFPWESSNV